MNGIEERTWSLQVLYYFACDKHFARAEVETRYGIPITRICCVCLVPLSSRLSNCIDVDVDADQFAGDSLELGMQPRPTVPNPFRSPEPDVDDALSS